MKSTIDFVTFIHKCDLKYSILHHELLVDVDVDDEVVDEFRLEAGVGAGVAGTGVVWFDVESEVV
jgi:hypothetical protein